jgi:MoxR-like ATPase
MGLDWKRVQFTPDILPSDLVGFSMYQKERGQFFYQPGAVMCNLFLADELNRTSPKTQSALLEVMEEGTVTVDQVTREVPKPFFVIATENPMGSSGTQMLPESQLDRFMICMTMGYPDIRHEIEIVKGNQKRQAEIPVRSVISAPILQRMQEQVEEIYIHDRVYQYIGSLIQMTREHPMIAYGVSPRGTIALAKMAKATAFLHGREYCTPKDVQDVFLAVAGHRISLNARARAQRVDKEEILRGILRQVPAPLPNRG